MPLLLHRRVLSEGRTYLATIFEHIKTHFSMYPCKYIIKISWKSCTSFCEPDVLKRRGRNNISCCLSCISHTFSTSKT